MQESQAGAGKSHLQVEQSPQVAGETGTKLAAAIQTKATPVLVVAVVAGAAFAAGALVVARSRPRRGWGGANGPSSTGLLARAVGVWLLRAAAARVVEALAAKINASRPGALDGHAAVW